MVAARVGHRRNRRAVALQALEEAIGPLLRAYRQWSGSRELPRIGILDWREVPTWPEFEYSAEYFRRQGIDVVLAELRARGEKV